MRNQLVYDIPTRIFHWLFAGLFIVAFTIAKAFDDDSPVYAFHSLAGIMLGFLVILRAIWGGWGTAYARFSSFLLRPSHLMQYFKSILSGQSKRVMGHNPASSWAAVVMMLLVLGLGTTGYLMTTGGDKEFYEEIHELFANGLFVVVLLHIAGIVLHTIRHRESIGLSMIDGKKMAVAGKQPITSARPLVGLFFVLLVGSFGAYLLGQYDSVNQSLQLFGLTLQLGEDESEGADKKAGTQREEGHEHGADDKDDDDD